MLWSAARSGRQTHSASQITRDKIMEIQEAYKQKMRTQLKEWSAEVDLLDAKLKNAGADLRVQHAEGMHELRAKQHAAADKLKELEAAGVEAWGQVKDTADKVWEDLKTGVSEARNKFK